MKTNYNKSETLLKVWAKIKKIVDVICKKTYRLHCISNLNEIIKGARPNFQSSKQSQKHVRNAYHKFHYYLTKFHFGTNYDSKEKFESVPSNMKYKIT